MHVWYGMLNNAHRFGLNPQVCTKGLMGMGQEKGMG